MSLLKIWKKQVKSSPIVRVMRIYWQVFYNEEQRSFGRRWERLCFLENIIKKRLPRKIVPSKVWFFAVKKKGIFNPFEFINDEMYLETLRLWRE